MSTPTKPRGTASGQPESPMQKLKALWLRLPETAQDYWRDQFSSSRSQADLRKELAAKFKITLSSDGKLSNFRAWLEADDQRLLMAEKIEARKKDLLAGGMTLEEAQDILLTEASAYSVAARDFKLGMKVSSEISGARNLTLAEKKAKRFDQAKDVMGDKALTEEQKRQRMLELFGM